MVGGGEAASRLTHQCHIVRISSESVDVVLDPLQGGHLVQHAGVAGDLLVAQGQEPEGSQSVVQCDEDNVMNHPELGSKPAS